jgi:lysozyme family protein
VLERFNGFGYRRHDINIHSPYLWSFSNHYTKGKFVADNTFSATAVSKQCGAAVLLKRMVARKLVKIEGATGNGSLPNP